MVDAKLMFAGNRVDYWLSRAGATTYAYIFIIESNTVAPLNSNGGRIYGRPLRCLSTVLDI